MKKYLSLIMVACLFSLVACGPSEEEKAKAEAEAKAAVETMFEELETTIDETEVVEDTTDSTTTESTETAKQ